MINPLLPVHHFISRSAIIGHETSWKISDFGAAQFKHAYDADLLQTIAEKARAFKEKHAHKKHLDLTYIAGAHRQIPEIDELIHDKSRLDRLSELAGTKLEPYPLSVIRSTITYMGPHDQDSTIDWHSDGVPVTELISLDISDPIIGGELEIYLGNCEVGKSITDEGRALPEDKILRIPHRLGYSVMGQFLGILHRTTPIKYGHRLTLNVNLRSAERSFVDDNRPFYLAADTDHDDAWMDEIKADVWKNQLPAYRRFEEIRTDKAAGQSASSPK